MGQGVFRDLRRSSIEVKTPEDEWKRTFAWMKRKGMTVEMRVPPKGEIRTGRAPIRGELPEEVYTKLAPPTATKPEKMIYGWLVFHKRSFQYQVEALGGRQTPGGAVLDFVIYDVTPQIALRVQSWWHVQPQNRYADDMQYESLQDMGYQVEDVWEGDVATVERLDATMREILFGVSYRPILNTGVYSEAYN